MSRQLPENVADSGNKLVAIGKIIRVHGLRGEVRVIPLSNIPDRLKTVERVFIESADGQQIERSVVQVRGDNDSAIMKFDGIDTRSDAETIRGAYVSIMISDAPKLDEGNYYSHELIGMSVVDNTGSLLGTIVRIESYPASDVLIVEGASGTLQLPAVRDLILSVDTVSQRMIVQVPEGLSDTFGQQ